MTGDQSDIKSRMATGQGNLFQPTYPQLRITVKLCGAFLLLFSFQFGFSKKYCLSLTGVDISGKRKTSQTNKKPHQHKASKSISKKEKKKKNGGNCKGTIRNIHQSLDNTQTLFLFFFPPLVYFAASPLDS